MKALNDRRKRFFTRTKKFFLVFCFLSFSTSHAQEIIPPQKLPPLNFNTSFKVDFSETGVELVIPKELYLRCEDLTEYIKATFKEHISYALYPNAYAKSSDPLKNPFQTEKIQLTDILLRVRGLYFEKLFNEKIFPNSDEQKKLQEGISSTISSILLGKPNCDGLIKNFKIILEISKENLRLLEDLSREDRSPNNSKIFLIPPWKGLSSLKGMNREKYIPSYYHKKIWEYENSVKSSRYRSLRDLKSSLKEREERRIKNLESLRNPEDILIWELERFLKLVAQAHGPHTHHESKREHQQGILFAKKLNHTGLGIQFDLRGYFPRIDSIDKTGFFWQQIQKTTGINSAPRVGDFLVEVSGIFSEKRNPQWIQSNELKDLLEDALVDSSTLTWLRRLDHDDLVIKTTLERKETSKKEAETISAHLDIIEYSSKKIAVIKIDQFLSFKRRIQENKRISKASTSDYVLEYLKRANKEEVDLLILDLRNNPGGVIQDAVKIARFFAGDVDIVGTENFSKEPSHDLDYTLYPSERPDHLYQYDKRGVFKESRVHNSPFNVYKGLLLILTNEKSASASELLTQSLKDLKRVFVAGAPSTFGKGLVVSISYCVETDSWSKIGTEFFYTPQGKCPQLVGVRADTLVPQRLKDPLTPLRRQSSYIFAPKAPWNTPFAKENKDTHAWARLLPENDSLVKEENIKEIQTASLERIKNSAYFQNIQSYNNRVESWPAIQTLNDLKDFRKWSQEYKVSSHLSEHPPEQATMHKGAGLEWDFNKAHPINQEFLNIAADLISKIK